MWRWIGIRKAGTRGAPRWMWDWWTNQPSTAEVRFLLASPPKTEKLTKKNFGIN